MTSALTVEAAAAAVNDAATPADLFGTAASARAVYREHARVLHPDAGGDADAFRRLNDLYEWWQTGIGPKHARRIVISTRRRTYALGELAERGDIANVYHATYDNAGTPEQVLVKMPRRPEDNDLMEAETAAYRTLADIDEPWRPYYPTLLETFRHQNTGTKTRRRVNVFNAPPVSEHGAYMTVADLLDVGRLDARDVAWIWRRVLIALGVAHDAGLVHGAPTPDRILIHPIDHAVILGDWCYSVTEGHPLKAVPHRWKGMYPPGEISDKRPATTALDVYLAHQGIARLLDPHAPRQFQTLISAASSKRPQGRPSAGDLLDGLDALLLRLYGPRKYRPLLIPTR